MQTLLLKSKLQNGLLHLRDLHSVFCINGTLLRPSSDDLQLMQLRDTLLLFNLRTIDTTNLVTGVMVLHGTEWTVTSVRDTE